MASFCSCCWHWEFQHQELQHSWPGSNRRVKAQSLAQIQPRFSYDVAAVEIAAVVVVAAVVAAAVVVVAAVVVEAASDVVVGEHAV